MKSDAFTPAVLTGLALLACWASGAAASPTANELQLCHRMASVSLQACLDEHAGATTSGCWRHSEQINEHCYAEVFARHSRPDPKRIAAEKKAAEAMRSAASSGAASSAEAPR